MINEFSNLTNISQQAPKSSNLWWERVSGVESQLAEKPPHLTPYYSLSLYILGIYALRVTPKLPPGSRFTWFAASAERKLIFKVEKSMNPEVLGCFSQFSNFSDFSWFWDALAINFDLLAWFPARGSFQIDRAWNFKLIQIFVFIWCSCGDPNSLKSRSRCISWTWDPARIVAFLL